MVHHKKTTLTAFVAVLLTVGAIWLTNRTVAPKQATWDDVLAEAKAGGYQITTVQCGDLGEEQLEEAIRRHLAKYGQDAVKG